METAARAIIVSGLMLAAVGVLLWGAARVGLGRLPGDILIERDRVWIVVPLATSIVLSLVLTVAINIAVRIWR